MVGVGGSSPLAPTKFGSASVKQSKSIKGLGGVVKPFCFGPCATPKMLPPAFHGRTAPCRHASSMTAAVSTWLSAPDRRPPAVGRASKRSAAGAERSVERRVVNAEVANVPGGEADVLGAGVVAIRQDGMRAGCDTSVLGGARGGGDGREQRRHPGRRQLCRRQCSWHASLVESCGCGVGLAAGVDECPAHLVEDERAPAQADEASKSRGIGRPRVLAPNSVSASATAGITRGQPRKIAASSSAPNRLPLRTWPQWLSWCCR